MKSDVCVCVLIMKSVCVDNGVRCVLIMESDVCVDNEVGCVLKMESDVC